MSFITPAAVRCMKALEARFPGIKFGIYNRRHINNDPSRPWSQHSWPNALDIYFTVPWGDTTPKHQSRLSEVHHYLKYQYPGWQETNYILWLVKNHFDHIHIDFWPKGYGTPSTIRGGASNRYKYSDGRIITQAQLEALPEEGEDELAILSESEQLELKDFLKFIKDEQSSVGFVKYAIRLIRKERGLPLHAPVEFDLDEYEIKIVRKEV